MPTNEAVLTMEPPPARRIAVNSLWTMALYSFYASFFLNTMPSVMGIDEASQEQEDLHISARWVFLRRWKGDDWYFNKFTPRLDLLAVAALLFTIVVLFASQSQRITTTFDSVLFSMVPFIFYFVVMFTGSFFMSQTCGATHAHSVTLAFTATSNNYELSLGVAVVTFGLDSDPAMMSVVAELIEIPTMLALVYLSLWLETKSRNTNRQLSLTSPKELAIESPSFLQS
ncbi:hypothetical protein PI124_g11941 [Phytophthora idaei]|nr:hypothetical protein PI125_g11590 [Phytophthora idaei]KAG3243239.1 hypothetical protein PI124_g11941 [Phytophthora idaei]